MEAGKLILSALVAMAVTLPFTVYMLKTGKIRPRGERIVEEAKAAGRIVQAVLEKSRWSRGDPGSQNAAERGERWFVTYRYEIGGRGYRFSARVGQQPPEMLELYYPARHPERAIPEGYRSPGGKYMMLVLLPVIVWVIVYNFVLQ